MVALADVGDFLIAGKSAPGAVQTHSRGLMTGLAAATGLLRMIRGAQGILLIAAFHSMTAVPVTDSEKAC